MSWNEIQDRAVEFAAKWEGETYEKGESQSFWRDFLDVYGIDRRRQGAFFEYAIKKISGKQGFIDLFWPGRLIAEQKSAGRDLDKANRQALEYLDTMPDHDLPRFIVASDFGTFKVLELGSGKKAEFRLDQFPERVKIFAPLIDEASQKVVEEDPVNREAAERMAELHNRLRDSRYTGHDLELLLVRLVFCLFADDALIFERGSFRGYLETRTSPDGSDLGPRLGKIFEVLNTPEGERQTTLDEALRAFPYINGGLFAATIRMPDFSGAMRRELLSAAALDWSAVSPAIFGSMFQGVMDETERRNLGAHYTSEKNILRLIKPLFLDDLYAEYARVRDSRGRLETFHKKLGELTFLDPACGCGNFLVITYRELRRLELKVVQDLFKGQQVIDVPSALRVNVHQMHGIEIEEFPSRIAQTALWLTDHQMNLEASRSLGQHYVRLPLTASPHIVHANALTTDWRDVVDPQKLDYILGNPPFNGSRMMSREQKDDLLSVTNGMREEGFFDLVAGWYLKAASYIQRNPSIEVAFVSTNSITQGEQVSILWKPLLEEGITINFAHRTFKWRNEGRGVAAVYCVIIGFGVMNKRDKRLFDYPDIQADPIEVPARKINPYLVDAPDVLIANRQEPLCCVPSMHFGAMPRDGGNLILSEEERDALLKSNPHIAPLIRKYTGSREFLNGYTRYCLWLPHASPDIVRSSPFILDRIEKTRQFRLASKAASTRSFAATPGLFCQIAETSRPYLLIPRVTSEHREYIPIGYMQPDTIGNDQVLMIWQATLYHFAVLTSRMHMVWVRAVCGRLKSDYRYSKDIVYNNFPWPEAKDADKTRLGALAQSILDARASHPKATLADLYDPLTMPPDLLKAHQAVDRAVDRLYRKGHFETDADRVALLFRRYQELTGR